MILQVSQGAIRYAGLEFATAMVKVAAEEANVPVVLHLDHGTDFDQNVRCLRAGFTSLMFDGSKQPYEENVRHHGQDRRRSPTSCGIPVEAELGKVLQSRDSVSEEDVRAAMTDPDQALDFVAAHRRATRWPSPSARCMPCRPPRPNWISSGSRPFAPR